MIRNILPISALLLGSMFLLTAGGINGLILPVRGTYEGFSSFALGLLGTGWAIGYVAGCVYTPRLVARVGHIRAFSILCATAAIVILLSLLMLSPWAWIPLRGVSGFCFAGAAMIVESWLNEEAEPSTRGRIFGVYMMVNLLGTTGGQFLLLTGDISTEWFFAIAAIFYSLALLPTAMSSSKSPGPLVSVRLDIGALWRNSPIAVVAVLMVGLSNSSFSTLAPVYGNIIGLSISAIVLFTSIPLLTGALIQIPVGILSDRYDRRYTLLLLAVIALALDLAFILIQPQSAFDNILLGSLLGGAIFAMYPVITAHANDHASPGHYIQTSGGLLMIYGIGAIIGPFVSGAGFALLGETSLFHVTAFSHVVLILFTIWRMTKRASIAPDTKTAFQASPLARTATPETAALARKDDEFETV
jgi:MFS family permease